jgi:hypothetical protein
MTNYDPEVELMAGLLDCPTRQTLKAARASIPAIPVVDDPLAELESNGGAADALCERLETEALIGAACDLSPQEIRKITVREAAPTALAKSLASGKRAEELNARLTALLSSQISRELVPIRAERLVTKRLDGLEKRRPLRKVAILKMLSPLRAQFNVIDDKLEERFVSLGAALEAFVLDRIVAEA